MALIPIARCKEIAEGTPDRWSEEFRHAVGTVAARLKMSMDSRHTETLLALQAKLLANGGPLTAPKLSKAELSAIRREASAKALVARSKAALGRRLHNTRCGIISLNDLKPAVFDAALEMIEDGQALCLQATTEVVYRGPIPKGGRRAKRWLVLAALDARIEAYQGVRECPWQSARKRAEEGTI
jgi:hypothetical protein